MCVGGGVWNARDSVRDSVLHRRELGVVPLRSAPVCAQQLADLLLPLRLRLALLLLGLGLRRSRRRSSRRGRRSSGSGSVALGRSCLSPSTALGGPRGWLGEGCVHLHRCASLLRHLLPVCRMERA